LSAARHSRSGGRAAASVVGKGSVAAEVVSGVEYGAIGAILGKIASHALYYGACQGYVCSDFYKPKEEAGSISDPGGGVIL
jgi:hypothetical protein